MLIASQNTPHPLKQFGQAAIPLVPIVSAGSGVEFIPEATALEQWGERLVGWKQTFPIAAGEKKIRRTLRIGSSRQNKRIVLPSMFTSPRTKNGRMLPVLPDSFYR